MKKRFLCAALTLALCLSPARAAEGEKFPAVNVYPGYADVREGDWFYHNAKLCYEVGLMTGTDVGFEPYKTLTVGECTAIAARMREALTGEAIPMPEGGSDTPWYSPYVAYLRRVDPVLTGLTAHAGDESTRHDFMVLLYAAIPDFEALLPAINAITVLPDTDDARVLKFYNAGVLTGTDSYGSFEENKTLTRAEAAAMVSRVARSELRQSFVPGDPLETPAYRTRLALEAAYLPTGAVVLVGVTSEQFLTAVNNALSSWEVSLRRAGEEFNWHLTVQDGRTVLEHVKEDTLSALGVTEGQGGELYQDFDYQVYYSRLIDLMGEPLGARETPGAGS